MSDWIAPLLHKLNAGTPVVRMAVATVRGSAPREPGATLLFWKEIDGRTSIHGSIGGGQLEARAMEIAAHLLQTQAEPRRVERFTLGATLGQCCGGVVELYWERFDNVQQAQSLAIADLHTGLLRYCAMEDSGREIVCAADAAREAGLPAADFEGVAGLRKAGDTTYFIERLSDDSTPLWLYGAGHIGKALVQVLSALPFHITLVDSREEMLSDFAENDKLTLLHAEEPEYAAAKAPDGVWHLVMTHSHDQDLRICAMLVGANRFGFLGLIGSATKDARFRSRLLQKGCRAEAVARMLSPIGIEGIHSKLPAAVAIAVAAQLLQQRERAAFEFQPQLQTQPGAAFP
jgi:xanthine dehydrogenase accessory factor